MRTLFLSYAAADREEAAQLVDGLRGAGFAVRTDDQLAGDADWWAGVLAAIQVVDAVLLLQTPGSSDSPRCRQEVAYALTMNVSVLAVRLERSFAEAPLSGMPDLGETASAAIVRDLPTVSYASDSAASAFRLVGTIGALVPKAAAQWRPGPASPFTGLEDLAQDVILTELTAADQQRLADRLREEADRPAAQEQVGAEVFAELTAEDRAAAVRELAALLRDRSDLDFLAEARLDVAFPESARVRIRPPAREAAEPTRWPAPALASGQSGSGTQSGSGMQSGSGVQSGSGTQSGSGRQDESDRQDKSGRQDGSGWADGRSSGPERSVELPLSAVPRQSNWTDPAIRDDGATADRAGDADRANVPRWAGDADRVGGPGRAGDADRGTVPGWASDADRAGHQGWVGDDDRAGLQGWVGDEGRAGLQGRASDEGRAGLQAWAGDEGRASDADRAGLQGWAGEGRASHADRKGRGDWAERSSRGDVAGTVERGDHDDRVGAADGAERGNWTGRPGRGDVAAGAVERDDRIGASGGPGNWVERVEHFGQSTQVGQAIQAGYTGLIEKFGRVGRLGRAADAKSDGRSAPDSGRPWVPGPRTGGRRSPGAWQENGERSVAETENGPAARGDGGPGPDEPDDAGRDYVVRDSAMRDSATRDDAVRDSATRDDAVRDRAARDEAMRDDAVQDDTVRDDAGWPDWMPGSPLGALSEDAVRGVAFAKPPIGRRGYDERDVDEFLDRAEIDLRARRAACSASEHPVEMVVHMHAADVRNARFGRPPFGKRGYDEEEVDVFLEQIERSFTVLDSELNRRGVRIAKS